MSTIFMAVQCFQCSTMQVKQEKKSSNKWTCVICNEKQSVRKVHARGPQAKDVRKFVQAFNSSRSPAGGGPGGSGWISPRPDRPAGGSADEGVEGGAERKRTDWSEYLDPEEEEEEDVIEGEDDGGVVVTTELPSRKPGRSFPKCTSKLHQGCDLKPEFSRIRKSESIQEKVRPAKSQRTGAASKWSSYLDSEDEEETGLMLDGYVSGFFDDKENMINGLIVEEEVHPDFV